MSEVRYPSAAWRKFVLDLAHSEPRNGFVQTIAAQHAMLASPKLSPERKAEATAVLSIYEKEATRRGIDVQSLGTESNYQQTVAYLGESLAA